MASAAAEGEEKIPDSVHEHHSGCPSYYRFSSGSSMVLYARPGSAALKDGFWS